MAIFLIDLPPNEMERRLRDALGVYVDAMRYPRGTEAALHIVRRQIDEEYRQLAVSSSSSDSVLCRGSVSCSASAERAYRHYRTRRWAMDERRLQHGDD